MARRSSSSHLTDPWYKGKPNLVADFTDTPGGYDHDITRRLCPETHLTSMIRSNIDDVVRIGTWDREGAYPYLVAEAERLSNTDKISGKDRSKVVLQCNGAPRDGTNENGNPFYAVRLGRLLVIGHADCFSHVKDKIEQMSADCFDVITSPGNQYRSSETLRASYYPDLLEPVRTDDFLPRIPDPKFQQQAGAFDGTGNFKVLPRDTEVTIEQMRDNSVDRGGYRSVDISLNGGITAPVALAFAGENLAKLGGRGASLVAYRDAYRGGLLTIVWPWAQNATVDEKIRRSAYYQFSSDPQGSVGELQSASFAKEGRQLHILNPSRGRD